MHLKVGSLFSGVGGLDLGLERAGMEILWQVENDPFCVKVLEKHWPHVKRYGDITALDPFSLPPVDLICGGFPCQPVSVAGRRKGIADERWIWPEFERVIRVLRPQYVLVENTPGLASTDTGRAMGEVLGDLAALGYDAEWQSIPAAAFGAPHLRYRIFIVAYTQRTGRGSAGSCRPAGENGAGTPTVDLRSNPPGIFTDFDIAGLQKRQEQVMLEQCATAERIAPNAYRGERHAWTPQSDVVRAFHGFSSWLDGSFHLKEADREIRKYADAIAASTVTVLQLLWNSSLTQALEERQMGGLSQLYSSQTLLSYLWKLAQRAKVEKHLHLLGTKDSECGFLRSLWLDPQFDGASYRRKLQKQFAGESTKALQALSQFLACSAEKAWAQYRRKNASTVLNCWDDGWELGFRRMVHGLSRRVDPATELHPAQRRARIKALGNAVVPQVAEWVGRQIIRKMRVGYDAE